ncbi:MAG: NGG1p interacting factor NIF3 [bacterium]
MELKHLYELAINFGIEADPRDKEIVLKNLEEIKKEYNLLSDEKKNEFDKEKLVNPYADTRILYGENTLDIKNVLIGIDIDGSEILLADNLKKNEKKIDLVISHHPQGSAYASFYEVMNIHTDMLNKYGVPINVAEGILKERINEVSRRVMPVNHQRTVDMAKLLDIPFMCIHTPADNHVASYLQKHLEEKNPFYVKDVVKILKEILEYKQASIEKAGPTIIVGNEKNRTGGIFVDMTGGTEGSKEAFEKLVCAGKVGTVVGMHFSEEHKKEAEKNYVNLIIAGHMASDNLGLNLLFDKIMKKEKINIISCSGFRRFER